jgi:hypothetical protein
MKCTSALTLVLVLGLRSLAMSSEPAQAVAGPLTVTPAGGVTQTIPQGGPFAPAGQSYTLTNTGTVSLDFSVTKTQAWVTVLPSSGTLAAGASTTVMVSMNGVAVTLGAGVYTDTVTFANITNGSGDQTRPMSLTVTGAAGGTLSVTSPSAWYTTVGQPGGPFSPGSMDFTLTNTGAAPLNFTVTNDNTWITASPASGTLAGGGSTTVTLSPNATANSLAVGTYQNLITFTNTSTANNNTVVPSVLMISPPGVVMTVIPATNHAASGPAGGPFTPPTVTYTITNVSPQPMNISISKTQPWLDIAPSFTNITLAIGVSMSYQVSVNAAANSLAPGTYTDTITINNLTTGQNNTTRTVTLTVTAATGDTTAPTVAISSPVPPTAAVSSSPATVSGTAADNVGVTSVSWSNGRTGGSGAATGTTSWSASIPLAPGNNLITITARDAAGNAATATITLDFTPPGGDAVPPAVAITTPTTAATFDATSSPQSMSGTASDNVAVSTVTWSNAATGASGTATGTTTWSALIALVPGPNAITVTAFDASGNSATDTITVNLPGAPAAAGGGKKKDDDGMCGMGAVVPPVGSVLGLLASALLAMGLGYRTPTRRQ